MEEVFELAIHCFGIDIDPDKVFGYAKKEYSKLRAWNAVCKEGAQHQWRKCHTKNYWAWVAL